MNLQSPTFSGQQLSLDTERGIYTRRTKHDHLIRKLQRLVRTIRVRHPRTITNTIWAILFVGFTVYFAFSMRHSVPNAKALIVITSLVCGYLVYAWIRDHFGHAISRAFCAPVGQWWDRNWHIIKWFLYPAVALTIIIYLAVDVIRTPRQLQSLAGMAVFFAIPWLTSKHPDKINWRPVIWGMLLQFVIGCLVLRWRYGYNAVQFLADQFGKFLSYSIMGGAQVFGDPEFLRHPFLMIVSPLIIYLGCVMAILYYWGVIQWVAAKIGWLMSISLHTTPIESVSLAVNIFLSVLDVILMLKDYLPYLTPSEFHCFLVGAHSTIAGFAFGLFILFGVSPQHLLTGAVMSAPAAVAFAKLNFPETEESSFKTDNDLKLARGREHNFIDAGIRGAWAAGKSILTINLQVMSFLGMYTLLDTSVEWVFERVGVEMNIATILGYVFIPVSFLMGVDWDDTQTVGRLLGLKVTANEFLSYIELGNLNNEGGISARSSAIATYAMCGFSSFGTLVIFSGVWQTVDPARTVQVLKQIPRIMLNANLSCFMTACLASILYSEDIDVVEVDSGGLVDLIGFISNLTPDLSAINAFFQRAMEGL